MNAQTDHLNRQRIQALELWQGPISISPLAGGMTNHNYLVKVGTKACVARVCEPHQVLGIDRRNEVLCQRAASRLGVAPKVVLDKDGILISEYIPSRAMTMEEIRTPEFLPRLAEVLRVLHSGWDRLTGEMLYFSVFQTIRTYFQSARRLKAVMPEESESLVEDARQWSHSLSPFRPALCHNDLLASNILDDGRGISLVDWEYAGVGHPLFDLAGVSANSGFSESLDRTLLAAYRGEASARAIDLRELQILKTMSHLRETFWAIIQSVISEIDFDYKTYADNCFQAYRGARSRLDTVDEWIDESQTKRAGSIDVVPARNKDLSRIALNPKDWTS